MSDWREQIVDQFMLGGSRIYVVSDPDGLLAEEEINRQVRERGFDVLPYEDPIAFRHAYETKYRRHWANGNDRSGLIVWTGAQDVSEFPYDILSVGTTVSLRLSDVFADLHVPAVRKLDPTDWDSLLQAIEEYKPGDLNAAETKAFILRHVYGVDEATIDDPAELLHLLLRRHYSERHVPDVIDEHLIDRLAEKSAFEDWPLDQIVPNAADFYAFLQERWPFYLCKVGTGKEVAEPDVSDDLEYEGPVDLPFGHPDVQSYVDSLFLDRKLEPVVLRGKSLNKDRWIRVGIQVDEAADRRYRFDRLLNQLRESLPDAEASYRRWLSFAEQWAELTVLRHRIEDEEAEAAYVQLRDEVDERFADEWMQHRYEGLYNQPPPVMLHHVPRILQRRLSEGEERVALLVVDGLALDQWIILRNWIQENREDHTFDAGALFAWVPTLTSVSRQSIFSGRMPQAFPGQLGTTRGEEKLWHQFWDDGPLDVKVDYLKVEGQRADLSEIRSTVQQPRTHVLGMVFYQIDEMMHGQTLGTRGMHQSVEQWAEQGAFLPTLDALKHEGYQVFITSDHGNVQATGSGKPQEGSTVDDRGRRARVYGAENLRASVADEYPESVEWPSIGLPDDYYPLLSSGRSMFDREGTTAIVHGGAALEEVIVPFIEVA